MRMLAAALATALLLAGARASADACRGLNPTNPDQNAGWLVTNEAGSAWQGGYGDSKDAKPSGDRVWEIDVEHSGHIVRSLYMIDGVNLNRFVEFGWHMTSNSSAEYFMAWQQGSLSNYKGPYHVQDLPLANSFDTTIGIAQSWGSSNAAATGRWNFYIEASYVENVNPTVDEDAPFFTQGYFVSAVERNNSCDDAFATFDNLHYRKAGARPGQYFSFEDPVVAPYSFLADSGAKCIRMAADKWATKDLSYVGAPCATHVNKPVANRNASEAVSGTWESN